MKTAFKWFDVFFNFLLASPLILGIIIFYINQEQINSENFTQSLPPNIGGIIGAVVTCILLISFLFSIIYIITGIVLIILGIRKRKKVTTSFGKGILIKGLVKGVIVFIFFFLLSLALSFYSIGGPTNLTLPRIPSSGDSNYSDTGFPIKDLQITHKKIDTDDASWCDITILNTNASMSATNVSVMDDGDENDYVTDQDHILPGKSYATSVYISSDNKNPCANVFIKDAGIVEH